jgi:tetratricopeptide (TPR) repeat protein
MSLLIKALDHLDKNKQAEKSKKLTGEYVADDALMLELMPVESKKTVEPEQSVETKPAVEEKLVFAEVVENTVTESTAVDRDLSLEEEAGLTGAHIAASKYAKPKLGVAKTADKLLDKTSAQTGAVKNKSSAMSQSGNPKNTTDQAKISPAIQNPEAVLNQKAAAKVFVANKAVKAPSSKSALVILGVAGALLVWLGLQGYSYIKRLTAPDVVVVNPVAVKPSMPIQPQVAPAEVATIAPAELPIESVAPNQDAQLAENQTALDATATNVAIKANTSAFENKVLEKPSMLEDVVQTEPKKSRTKKTSSSDNEVYTGSVASYNSAPRSNAKRKPLKLISKAASSGVDPTLMTAYQAYTRGDDATAQQQYRQVLQRDVRNVDALLGMAAIAQRQGRDADAAGWYQKVLEIEPKNTIALSAMMGAAMASPQANGDTAGTESRIKSMLAQQPETANLYAALGNLYIEQGQWSSAQEAYFNASRLAPNNADYAFNLAISLDQMGKASLALRQYERALELLDKSGGTSPDRATLEARIRELQ